MTDDIVRRPLADCRPSFRQFSSDSLRDPRRNLISLAERGVDVRRRGCCRGPGLALTHNAFWVEPLGNGSMCAYFMTESDNQADLLVYDATPWVNR
jgi:hypothetical protein